MKNFLMIVLVTFFLSCENANEVSSDGSDFHGIMNDQYEEIPVTNQTTLAEPNHVNNQNTESEGVVKKVIKTGDIEFQSKDIEKDYQSINKILSGTKAYIENESQSKTTDRVYYNLTIRVPADQYDTLFSKMSGIAFRLDRKSSNIQDVTERYYDLKTRIKNKKVLESRYIELLQQANEISEILEIEQKLNEVRTEIESLEGQFRYLSKQVSFSTINLSFYEELPYSVETRQRKGFGQQLSDALSWGWQGFLVFIVGLISVWPFLLLAIGSIFGIRWFRNYKKEKVSGKSL
jgi:hypothetical protein